MPRCTPSRFAIGSLLAALLAAPAGAGTIYFDADPAKTTEGLGDFSGSLDYIVEDAIGMLVVSLTNMTNEDFGGYITGFVFNIDGEEATATLLESSYTRFESSGGKASPYGSFESGAALRGNFLGGGAPRYGIGIGDTGSFTFLVEGIDAPALTSESFLSLIGDADLVVRFRGMGEDSDKVVAAASRPVPPPVIVPVPPALALGLLGLAGVAGGRRLTRRRTG